MEGVRTDPARLRELAKYLEMERDRFTQKNGYLNHTFHDSAATLRALAVEKEAKASASEPHT